MTRLGGQRSGQKQGSTTARGGGRERGKGRSGEKREILRQSTHERTSAHAAVIYVMDARTILSPAASVEIDWDTVMEPLAKSAPTRPESELEPDTLSVAAKLSADDIEAVSVRQRSGQRAADEACPRAMWGRANDDDDVVDAERAKESGKEE